MESRADGGLEGQCCTFGLGSAVTASPKNPLDDDISLVVGDGGTRYDPTTVCPTGDFAPPADLAECSSKSCSYSCSMAPRPSLFANAPRRFD